MRMTSLMFLVLSLLCAGTLQAQDAATQERLDKLSGQIEDLIATQRAQQKQVEALAREMDSLREQVARPSGNYASQDDIKRLTDALRDLDRKRIEDSERVSTELGKLAQLLKDQRRGGGEPAPQRAKPEKGYTYTIQSGDTLSMIIQAYREKGVRVSMSEILKANPGLVPEKMPVGKEIWIPAP